MLTVHDPSDKQKSNSWGGCLGRDRQDWANRTFCKQGARDRLGGFKFREWWWWESDGHKWDLRKVLQTKPVFEKPVLKCAGQDERKWKQLPITKEIFHRAGWKR